MATGANGTAGKSLDRKEVGKFLFYVLIIAVCIGILFWMLFNARPSVEPKIKNGGQSMVLPRAVPFAFYAKSYVVSLYGGMARNS